jgi:hypothetical protein
LREMPPKLSERLAAWIVDGAESVLSLGPIWMACEFVNFLPIDSDDPPSPLAVSRYNAPELVTSPATELAPASVKVSSARMFEMLIDATVPKLAVTWGVDCPYLIATALDGPGRPALQSLGVSQLSPCSWSSQMSTAMAFP